MIWCLLVLKDTAVVNGIGGSTLNPSYETTTEHLIGIIEEATFSTDSVTFASITDRSFTTDPVKNTDNEVHSKETTFSTDSVTFGPSTDRSFTTGSVEKPTTPEPDSDPEFGLYNAIYRFSLKFFRRKKLISSYLSGLNHREYREK